MPRMIDLIESSEVPANIVQSAAKGALALPATEMVEILVYLANHSPIFGEQARLTLAGWDENSSRAIAADLSAPKEVLNYMVAPQNMRPVVLPTLLENISIPDGVFVELAATASGDAVDLMLRSARVTMSYPILAALHANPKLSGIQAETIKQKLVPLKLALAEAARDSGPDDVLDEDLIAYLADHAGEIADEEGKPYQAIGGIYEDILESPEALAEFEAANAAAAKAASGKKSSSSVARGSALHKISKLDVKGRIQLAMKGSKEERSILIRDGTKVVALAVLESPKISDAEAEMFANQKNVLEAVLRGIAMKRRFMKHYPIVRNVVSNPRTPLDISLTLIKHLLPNDLKNVSGSKDVSDTVRKLALKMYKQKLDAGGGKK
jgi:hypothetical protein